jgi:hypothetical protein
MNLVAWMKLYAKYKYQCEPKESENTLTIEKGALHICMTALNDVSKISKLQFNASITNWIVVSNIPESIDAIVIAWNILVKMNIRVLFVDIKNNITWAVIPAVHTKIVEKENIKASLVTLSKHL